MKYKKQYEPYIRNLNIRDSLEPKVVFIRNGALSQTTFNSIQW